MSTVAAHGRCENPVGTDPYTVEPAVATACREQPPLLGHQFYKILKVIHSNRYIWNLL